MSDDLVKRLRRASVQKLPLNDYFKAAADRITALEAENAALKVNLAEAINIAEERGRCVPFAPMSCEGWKCGQPWCFWCSGASAAEAEVAAITERETKNRTILAQLEKEATK